MSMSLITLTIKNSYCHESLTLNFSEGINYIVGVNESGKSEALSMIPYAFFGSPALRDSISAYKKLEVTQTFKVRDDIYTVFRSDKSTYISDVNGKEIATGSTPVTKFIINLLGYDFDIFNKTNYTQQSDAEMYNKMTKTEMTKFVEKASGVENAKEVEKALDTRRKELNAAIKTLKSNLTVSDIDFVEDKELEEILVETPNHVKELSDAVVTCFNSIKDFTSVLSMAKTKQDAPVFSGGSLEAAYKLLDDWTNTLSKFDLKALERSYNERERAILDRDRESNSFDRYNRLYDKTLDWYEEQKQQLDINKLLKEKEKLLSKGDITCPSCTHSFPLMYDSLAKFDGLEYKEVTMSETEISSAISWKKFKSVEAENTIKDLNTKINNLYLDCENYVEFSRLKEQQITLSRSVSNYHEDLERYETNNANILKALNGRTVEEVQQALDTVEHNYAHFNEQKEYVTKYLQTKSLYDVRMEFVNKCNEDLLELEKELAVVEKALSSSKEIKLNLQQKFIPTLNSKASSIVQQITDGKRHNLQITDDFTLTMDNHNIRVFSGSAKVVANIAFRLAYVETFYSKSFPVFIGDEIDSFFDPDRAKDLHSVFKELEGRGYQIILISHFTQDDGNIIDINELKGEK